MKPLLRIKMTIKQIKYEKKKLSYLEITVSRSEIIQN